MLTTKARFDEGCSSPSKGFERKNTSNLATLTGLK